MIATEQKRDDQFWVIQNLKSGKFFAADDGRGLGVYSYDSRLVECTIFESQEAAYDKATLLHARISPTGEGINFKVISYEEAYKQYLENVGGQDIDK